MAHYCSNQTLFPWEGNRRSPSHGNLMLPNRSPSLTPFVVRKGMTHRNKAQLKLIPIGDRNVKNSTKNL